MSRGVLYVVWGDRINPLLERSVDSVRRHLPGVPWTWIRADPALGLSNKPQEIARWRDYDTTLFLDADTVALGDLSRGFEAAERHGLACCVGECPWLRRFDRRLGDATEYNTGVLFFSRAARPLLEAWAELDPYHTGRVDGSVVDVGRGPVGLECDDQLSFGKAVAATGFNPHVLPMNWNFRPGWHTRFFLPLKVWHSVHPVPEGLEEQSLAVARGDRPVQFCTLQNPVAPNPRLGGVG